MKILIISKDFPNIVGGVSDYTYHLSKNLSKKRIDVYVLTSCNEKVIREIKGYNVKILPLIKKWGFFGIYKIIKVVEMINPDSIFLQYVPYLYNYYGIPLWIPLLGFILRFKNFELNITFHEIAIRFDIKKIKYIGIAIIQRIIAYILCAFSKRIIVSITHYKKMVNFFSKKISIIPIGPSILPIELDENEIKKIKNRIAPDREFVISIFGQGSKKNEFLIPVIKMLNEEGLKTKLLFIGKFPFHSINTLKEKAEELGVAEFLYFTGYLPSEEVYKHLCASDIFISLENVDKRGRGGISTKSGSLAAAYAAGLPIIGTKGDMTDDFFKNLENIFLIEKLEVDEIVNAIKKIIDKELYNRLKYFSKKTYEEKLSWEVISEKYKNLILNG